MTEKHGDRAIRAIVFDMGGVLMTFNGLAFARAFTASEEDAQLLNDALFNRGEWGLLDSGTIGHDTMKRLAAARLPERLLPNLEDCFEHWQEHSEPIPEMNELAARLDAQGYDLYLLSNASTRIDGQLKFCPAWPLMKGRVVSGFERMMKPDPEIFELLCDRFELEPERCLFVDDNADNCAGARVAGMHAFHFTGDASALAAEIERLG